MILEDKLVDGVKILERAIATYRPKKVFGLLSGGHDSTTVTHFAATTLGERLDAVVHINTGIGIKETRDFVRQTCDLYGWPLLEYKAVENVNAKGEPDPKIYRDIVLKFGFPGVWGHVIMYSFLKQRQISRLARDHGATPKEPIMLISGCRRQESTRRMGNVEEIAKEGRLVWVAPFADLSAEDVNDYMATHNLPRNPVKDLIHMSGECLCGAFAHPGELAEIEMWFPETAAHIRAIEAEVRAAGFPWGWEDKPPAWFSRERKKAKEGGDEDAFFEEMRAFVEQGLTDEEITELFKGGRPHLCTGCGKRDEENADGQE